MPWCRAASSISCPFRVGLGRGRQRPDVRRDDPFAPGRTAARILGGWPRRCGPLMNRYSQMRLVSDHSHQPGRPLPGASSAFSTSPADTGPRSANTRSTSSTKPGCSANAGHRRCPSRSAHPAAATAAAVRSPSGSVTPRGPRIPAASGRPPLRPRRVGRARRPGTDRTARRSAGSGPGEHVDRVDLQQPDRVDQSPQMAAVDDRRRSRAGRTGRVAERRWRCAGPGRQ